MNPFVHLRLGHFLMNEAGADGGQGGGAPAAAPASSNPGTGTPPAQQGDTLLGSQPPAQPAAQPGEQQAGEKPQQPQIPEKYEFANLPEGYKLDEAATAEWSAVFKEAGFTQDQVNKLVAMDAKRMQATAESYQAQAQQFRQQQLGEWAQQLKSDPDFGGAKFEANVAVAQQALAAYGSPELSQWLSESGAGSNPALVRLFHKIGQELAEGRLHRTTSEVPAGDRPLANRMYPNLN